LDTVSDRRRTPSRMSPIPLAIVALLAFGTAASAQSPIAILSPGGTPCEKWTAEPKDSPNRVTRSDWVYGFVSAYNLFSPDGEDVKPPDAVSINAWITTYCSGHPADSLATASVALVGELRSRKGLSPSPAWILGAASRQASRSDPGDADPGIMAPVVRRGARRS
jgi:hypothetical protein